MPRYIHLTETASTNSYLAGTAHVLPGGTVIYTFRQTAGRGQKGNHWESQDNKNLTFSMLLKDTGVEAAQQFCISEAVALAIVDVLQEHAGAGFSIKWPNDIYYHDSKICGLLIENSLRGTSIEHSVVGVGLNINQLQFVSDVPNPISLSLITGQEYNLEQLLHEVCQHMELACDALKQEQARHDMHQDYLKALYRNDGAQHPFARPDGTQFMASIVDVAPDGLLTLRHSDGSLHGYAFREVKHVIDQRIL